MKEPRQFECLNKTFFCWKYLGIWPENNNSKSYKIFSYVFIFFTVILYGTLLLINLFFMPLKIEVLIEEVTFFFSVLSVTSKVIMVLVKKQKIYEVLEILNCKELKVNDDITRNIVKRDTAFYEMYWRSIFCIGNVAYCFKCVVPVIAHLTLSSYKIKLPTSNYYFLSEDYNKREHFKLLFFYQAVGVYGLMTYDVSIDTFVNGILNLAITQIKILNYKFASFKSDRSTKFSTNFKERRNMIKLKEWLRHYDEILKYCTGIQDILTVALFIQYTMSSLVICVVSCGLLLPRTNEQYAFQFIYLLGMVLQIFAPAWLGTQITYQSQELVFAAYNSDWIARTEQFKRSIKIFMVRTNTTIVIDGLKLFPLSLETFTSIMKTAYSFVTLVRYVQDGQTKD